MNGKFIALLSLTYLGGFAQTDTTKNSLKISGYIETYYSYDFSNPLDHKRPGFIYSHNRHNEVNVNLGFLKAGYDKNGVRSNLALMTGSYANANLSAEPGVLKGIFEANVGVKISKKNELWIDAGIFASHIGFESAIGKDCWNLTRSILADNSPYSESGAKISYTSNNEKWFVSGLILNGWQRIQRVNGTSIPAFGHQLTFRPNLKVTVNSSSFVGSDKPDSARQMRYFHNFYAQISFNKRLGGIAGFDIGSQQKSKGSSEYHVWYSTVLIARYSATDRIVISARGEYYSDANGVIISAGIPAGFQTYGYSLNFDYNIRKNAVFRVEGRGFSSRGKNFMFNNLPSTQNYFVTTALAISF